jgi:hypothetical protein
MWKKRFIVIFSILIFLILISFPSYSTLINTFNNSLSTETLVFTGNENVTRYLRVFKDANITEANITLDIPIGSNPWLEVGTNDGTYEWNQTGVSPFTFNVSPHSMAIDGTVDSGEIYKFNDSDFTTGFFGAFGADYVDVFIRNLNFTSLPFAEDAYNKLWFDVNATVISPVYYGAGTRPVYCWNWSSDSFVETEANLNPSSWSDGSHTTQVDIISDCISSSGEVSVMWVDSGFGFNSGTGRNATFNETLLFYNVTKFVTNDLTTSINSALNNSNCDCVGCNLDGNYCEIPFTFHLDSAGNIIYSDLNVEWNEVITPDLVINEPNETYVGISTIPLNVTLSENEAFDTCYYNVTNETSIYISNTILTCNESLNDTFSVTIDGNYTFYFFVNDSNNNVNTSSTSFEVQSAPAAPPTGGGGGGGVVTQTEYIIREVSAGNYETIIIRNGEDIWSMQTDTGTEKYQFSMSAGSDRTRDVLFENLGERKREITMSCEDVSGNLCDYVIYENTEFELLVQKEVKVPNSFTLNLPENITEGDYVFNIIATDQEGNTGVITAEISVSRFGIITDLVVKLFSTKDIGGIPIPYILFFFLSLVIVGVITYYIGLRNIPFGAGISIVLGLISGGVIVIVL